MTKKIFAMFLALLMVVSLLPTSVFAAGCPAVHTKDNCEYTQVGEPVAPTCGEQGYTRYKCNACGKEFIADQVPAVGEHTWVDAEDVPETCEQDGWTGGKTCSVCKKTVDQTKVDKIPNDANVKCVWEDLTPNIDCTTGGTKQYQCKVCGATKKGEEIKENTPHTWSDWTLKTAATAEVPGLAERKCSACNKVEECVVFASHDHVLVDVAEVAPKCEVAGVAAHKVCRICNVKFGPKSAEDATLVEKTDADLRINTLHEDILKTLNCKTTTYVCGECDKVIKVDAAANHKYGEWVVLTQPTCTTDGFQKRECGVEGCPNIETAIIPALGHIERNWTVDATCAQYGYTFTYCLRAGCVEVKTSTTVKVGNTEVEFDLTEGFSNLAEPVVGAGFYMSMVQGKLEKTLYFTGKMDGYYFATSEDIADAVLVYLEEVEVEGVEKAYRMYFFDGETKNYIAVIKNGTYNNVKFGADYADKYWTWNEEFGILTTKAGDDVFFLGTDGNKTYKTFSACKIKYAEENFLAQMTVSNANGVALLDIEVNVEGGFNAENHANAQKVTTLVPTCKEGVTNTWLCYACSVSWTKEEAAVDHKWVADTSKDCAADCALTHVHVKDGVQKANCTDKGAKYFVCGFGCGETKVEEEAAKGHSAIYEEKDGVKVDVVYTVEGGHTNVTVYDYKVCYYCGVELEKTNFRVWEGVGKLWDSFEKADEAHDGKLAAEAEVEVEGDCSKVGYKGYKCSECGEVVRVKTATTGAHVYSNNQHKDPTCTAPGFDVNERCQRCDQLKDKTLEEGKVTELPKKEHNWYTPTKEERKTLGWTEEYKAADCDKPNYENWIAYCKDCGELKNDGTKLLNTITVSTPASLCGPVVYEWYTCHCGENHIRNYVGKIAHVYIDAVEGDVEGDLKLDATCTAPGFIWKKCQFCGETKKFDIAQKPHQNKDKVEFVDSCIDTVADRHCVLCCACANKKDHDCTADQDKDTKGVQTCACVIPAAEHNWDREDTFVPAHCAALPYSMRVCEDCGKIEVTNYPGYWDGETKDAKGNPVLKPIVGLNHTPVAYEAGADKAANLKYIETDVYSYYLADDGMLRQEVKTITGIYTAYTAATFSAAGSASFVCSQCNEEVTIELPALTGLGFELVAENANGQDGLTKGSLVNVTLYVSGSNVAVNHFELTAQFGTGMIFVGAQSANDDFGIFVTEAANAKGTLEIIANAVNTADKKQQNITIGDKTPIATMQFIVWTEEAVNVNMTGSAQDLAENDIKCAAAKECKIEVRKFMDFNDDGFTLISDLVQAEAILTGESEKTYDVTVDADKDGEITLYDLTLIYEYNVNKMDAGALNALIFVGMAEEHVEIVREALGLNDHKHVCNNPYCSYTAAEAFEVCPACYKAQNKN